MFKRGLSTAWIAAIALFATVGRVAAGEVVGEAAPWQTYFQPAYSPVMARIWMAKSP